MGRGLRAGPTVHAYGAAPTCLACRRADPDSALCTVIQVSGELGTQELRRELCRQRAC